MELLTKEQIIAVDDIKTEAVEVPEWGGTVLVRVMSAKDRDTFEAGKWRQVGKEMKLNMDNQTAKLVAMTLVDGDKNRMFSVKEVEALAEKSSLAMERVASVALRINAIHDEAIEDAVKN